MLAITHQPTEGPDYRGLRLIAAFFSGAVPVEPTEGPDYRGLRLLDVVRVVRERLADEPTEGPDYRGLRLSVWPIAH